MTPQQEKVLAAFRQLSIRTIGGLALDLQLPRPSIRRCIGALRLYGYIEPYTNGDVYPVPGTYQYTPLSDAHGV